jgi:hypothetical protein
VSRAWDGKSSIPKRTFAFIFFGFIHCWPEAPANQNLFAPAPLACAAGWIYSYDALIIEYHPISMWMKLRHPPAARPFVIYKERIEISGTLEKHFIYPSSAGKRARFFCYRQRSLFL